MDTAIQHLFMTLQKFRRDRHGATAIEYALIAGGISIVIVVSVNALGANVLGLFTIVKDAF